MVQIFCTYSFIKRNKRKKIIKLRNIDEFSKKLFHMEFYDFYYYYYYIINIYRLSPVKLFDTFYSSTKQILLVKFAFDVLF